MTRRLFYLALATVVPGGFIVAAGVIAYRYWKRRQAKQEVDLVLRQAGWMKPWLDKTDVRA